ncbi:histidine--tRNA ligase [Sulfidibacter corallicola]|uniref:Histidine--tRNA ligase n=1 Tax=Sulfidibacter corallicola TaxID=2818388 RepID=A0A8A4TIR3_SULCO|nr:histidine--tRNA ligase [Sulfidibacter corallicola]QTD48741.1 histidine--tRNA ligase [Sulfidibacter corallicola]
MELIKPKTMPGVMELLPNEQIAFQNMLDVIRRGYERFGFLPLETPVMEYSNILLTKSGGETERQVYFVQSSGSLKQGRDPELAMRFDLTVPTARFVAEHERKLVFPFRRYQIQRVYRGETAQRGRFREFYQCDVDVIGKDKLSLHYDAEIPSVIYHVFSELNVGKFTIHINNRKLLSGFFAALGVEDPERQTLIMREVDKIDKRGRDYVVETLTGEHFGMEADKVHRIMDFIAMEAESNRAVLDRVAALGIDHPLFQTGLEELSQVVETIEALGVPESHLKLNLSIARGLDYYTGTVYETFLDDHLKIGSVCSGGRYENLAGYYTSSKLPGVGISIGATRLFYQLCAAGIIQAGKSTIQALVTQMDADLSKEYLNLTAELRQGGVNTILYAEKGKFGKQLRYADRAGIRFAVIMGRDELDQNLVTVKDLIASDQFQVPRDRAAAAILERIQSSN